LPRHAKPGDLVSNLPSLRRSARADPIFSGSIPVSAGGSTLMSAKVEGESYRQKDQIKDY
jgi:hypothetical protein